MGFVTQTVNNLVFCYIDQNKPIIKEFFFYDIKENSKRKKNERKKTN